MLCPLSLDFFRSVFTNLFFYLVNRARKDAVECSNANFFHVISEVEVIASCRILLR